MMTDCENNVESGLAACKWPHRMLAFDGGEIDTSHGP